MSSKLIDLAGHSGASTGDWYQTPGRRRTHNPVAVSITVGSATVEIQGRIDSESPVCVLDTVTASGGLMIADFPQVRVVVTSATNATIVVSIDANLRLAQ